MEKTRLQVDILKYIEIAKDLQSLNAMVKKGMPDLRIASELVVMARKGFITKDLATRFVKGMPIEKVLTYEFGSQYKN